MSEIDNLPYVLQEIIYVYVPLDIFIHKYQKDEIDKKILTESFLFKKLSSIYNFNELQESFYISQLGLKDFILHKYIIYKFPIPIQQIVKITTINDNLENYILKYENYTPQLKDDTIADFLIAPSIEIIYDNNYDNLYKELTRATRDRLPPIKNELIFLGIKLTNILYIFYDCDIALFNLWLLDIASYLKAKSIISTVLFQPYQNDPNIDEYMYTLKRRKFSPDIIKNKKRSIFTDYLEDSKSPWETTTVAIENGSEQASRSSSLQGSPRSPLLSHDEIEDSYKLDYYKTPYISLLINKPVNLIKIAVVNLIELILIKKLLKGIKNLIITVDNKMTYSENASTFIDIILNSDIENLMLEHDNYIEKNNYQHFIEYITKKINNRIKIAYTKF